MEMRDFARTVLTTEELEEKLRPASGPLTDLDPGPPFRATAPGRPPHLRIEANERTKAPPIQGFADPAQRPRILSGLANHELQAAELFAWALLAFPDTPAEFRRGLARILDDEQRHTRMYLARLEAHGGKLGDHPLHGYFWSKVDTLTTPLRFICAMSLTFENANLDHTVDYAAAARKAKDPKTAAVIEQVHRDEIDHVRFGWTWLAHFKGEEQSMWEAFQENLTWPLRPFRAKGRTFHREGREAAGLDGDFIERIEIAEK
jgi:uncharacterized ferritin-like protein (DUF455 family)